ncbi:DUF485 domain-containing protein [Pseudonocardia kunmingensis]|nr:DUF485 domain-containing protein [Pseudonocardia kunmingensis]
MAAEPVIDWLAVSRSKPFAELVARRGRFVRTAAVVLLAWFAAFLAVVGAAPDLAGSVVGAGMTVGFLLGLSQFVLAWALTWRYLRLSTSVFAGLEERARAAAGLPAGAEAAAS